MARRPIWKGQIRLSLVSIPVELFSATSSAGSVSFHQIDRNSGQRIHYEKVADGVGPVSAEDIVRGFEVAKDEYVVLTDEELDAVKLETRKTLDLVQFVETSEIPPLYYDKPYYVVPQDELAEDAFRVVRDALRHGKKTGLGQITMRGKEYLVALRPCGSGMLLETLHYADELRKADELFEDIAEGEADDELLAVAKELIERKTSPFKAKAFKNHYVAAVKELVAEKRRKHGKLKIEEDDEEEKAAPKKSNVVDLMASLKKSLERSGPDKESKTGKESSKRAAKPAAKRKRA